MTQGTALFSCFRHFVTATEGELACLPYTRIFPTPSLYQSCSAGTVEPEVPPPLRPRHSPVIALCVVATAFLRISLPQGFPSHQATSLRSSTVSAQGANRIRPVPCQSQSNPNVKTDFMCADRVLRQKGPQLVNNPLLLPGISVSPANLGFHEPQQRSLILHSLMPSFWLFPLTIMSADPSRLLSQRLPVCEVFSGSEVGFFWIRVSGFACLPR